MMANNRNRNQKNGKNQKGRSGREEQVVQLLKELVEFQDQSRNRMVPEITDVPMIWLSRKRTYTTAFSYTYPVITANSSTPTTGAIAFSLGAVPDIASAAAFFESYRILQARVEFVPYGVGLTGTSNTNGTIYTAIDYDDANAPTDESILVQYDSLQSVQSSTFFERRLEPRAAKAMYSGTLFNGYGQEKHPWIATNSLNVQHYGLKYVQTISSSAVTTYRPLVTLIVQFRESH